MANLAPTPKDAAAKERIIKHMNADHQVSLSYYLQHFKKLSASEARSPLLEDVSFESMTVRASNGKTHSIPFNPPMKTWADARGRTVDMDREARDALDISDVRVTEYHRPRSPFHVFVFTACLFTMVIFMTRSKIVPGTWFYDKVLPWFPGGPEWFVWIVDMIGIPVLGIHLTEVFLLDRTRLRKYGVERGSSLWWKWMASCFIEGFGCFQRIDAMVRRTKKAIEKGNH
ncbi:uncharacterized protein BP5553_00131 [Venustampulla echinocandica]|uniref:DUF2470 domain-containing protein n=1 Tax=Venustampulla echinocandica TaxID=2656787 RepID=A0A370TXA1_9HELO|nr:uncharacterized protein BP5553_00131 [Venustampulla echinocandica]RDL40152.1 hypothetical protein BP5553_00131 [Venustampulla echinocandica]